MGKRKERRLAAMAAANRRVKLDLFAEPSGEMLGTSSHDEVGGDLDQNCAGVPTSPSSSGQRQENPLLLLGQYSDDDELDEEDTKRPNDAADENFSTDLDGQVQEPIDTGENVEGNTEKDLTSDDNEQHSVLVDTVKNLDGNDVEESNSTYESVQYSKTAPAAPISIPEPSGIQFDGDLTDGWKVVMHEESNRYYYWNTVTGETSWEVPSVLAGEQIVSSAVGGAGSHVDVHASTELNPESVAFAYGSDVDGLGGSDMTSKEAREYGGVLDVKNENGEVEHLAYDANHSLTHYGTAVASIPYADSSALSDFGSSQQSKSVTTDQLAIPVEHHVSSDETADVHSARLVKYSESLLQRLEALDRSGNRLERHELVMKEIEIRLSDCIALSSYGSSLLPLWWHTEAQLKQLESAINNGEASWLVHSKHDGKLDAPQNSSLRDECSLQSIGTAVTAPEVVEKDKGMACTVENSFPSPTTGEASKVEIETSSQVPDSEDVKINNQHLGNEQPEILPESYPNTLSVHLESALESHADEDVDMDVEMEVDEETPSVWTAAGDLPSTECHALEQLIQPNMPSSACPSVPLDESSVPPPPEEEWIPPPPPDAELVPPPPPEEPEPSFPPPYAEAIPCPPYPDQYNLAYTVPSYEYYTPTVGELTNGNYYAHAEGSHIADPQAPPYHEPVVASALPEVAVDVNPVQTVAYYDVSSAVDANPVQPVVYYDVSSAVDVNPVQPAVYYDVSSAVDVNPVQPVVYYDVSSGTVPPGSVVSSMGPSAYYIESGSISYHGTVSASDHTGSVGFSMESGSSSLPTVNLQPDTSAVVTDPQTSTLHSASVASTVQAVATALVNGSDVKAPPSAAPKNQTKVARSKKRTVAAAPAFRSNKKVSSLVDKWKAAKEELHGDEEEEPENAYEVLEKKRQKEIEEWRARQLASGEAQVNANFLPLGGDWRERVKRKKAEPKPEAVQTPSEVVDNERKQPDLVELSKDLRSGWQAYWDESTKEVYYGNSITSETTWTRPTR